MVNVKTLGVYLSTAFHADAAVTDVDNFADTLPVRLHEKITEAARAAERMPVAQSPVAANAAKSSAFGIFAPGEALFIALAFTVAHVGNPYPHS